LFLIGLEATVAWLSGVGRVYRNTLLALLVGAFTLTLFQIFGISEGKVVFFLIPWLQWGKVTDQGLYVSLIMSLRMIASVGSIPLMVVLTPATQMVSLISGTFRLPPAYTCVLITALRFVPTFAERMSLVMQAEASRGYRADTANPFRKMGMILRMSLPLLVTCVRDVDALALSLESRGFTAQGNGRRPASIPLSWNEAFTLILSASGLAVLVFLS
ncbi:MAG: energy-coupling factor transporter transmembrane component T, partial [Spirochaetales bacterium]